MEEFSKPRYNVDVLKVEVPIVMEFVEGTKAFKGEAAYTREEALEHFRTAAAVTSEAVYLSFRWRFRSKSLSKRFSCG